MTNSLEVKSAPTVAQEEPKRSNIVFLVEWITNITSAHIH